MNRLPEPSRAELNAEDRLTITGHRPQDPELAADWDLRCELRRLNTPPLPADLRSRVMNATHTPRHRAPWWGLAAAVVLGLAVALIIEPFDQPGGTTTVAESDLEELKLALDSLELGARRAGSAAGSQLSRGLTMTRIDLDEVPYANRLGRWIQPQSSHND